MEFLELSKYIELEKRGLTAPEVSVIAQQDGLESILVIHVLKSVFELSIDEAQEIYMTTEGSKHPLAFNKGNPYLHFYIVILILFNYFGQGGSLDDQIKSMVVRRSVFPEVDMLLLFEGCTFFF